MKGSNLKVKNAEETGSALKIIVSCETKSSVHGKTSTLRTGGDGRYSDRYVSVMTNVIKHILYAWICSFFRRLRKTVKSGY